MYYDGYISYNGVRSNTYPVIITEVPAVTHSEIRGDSFVIPGRDGELYVADIYRDDAEIRVSFVLSASKMENYREILREVRQWLSGSGTLIISDATDSYYEVKKVTIATDSRLVLRYGVLEAVFTVYPYEFLTSGDTGVTSYSSITNDADESMPLYKIEGDGDGTLTVNDNTMTFSVEDELYIDTRRQIAYDQSGDNMSSSVSGDYSNLYLNTGTNTVSITSGFTLTVIPRWGYKI